MKPITLKPHEITQLLEGKEVEVSRVVKPKPINVPEGAYIDPYNGNYDSFTVWTKDNKMCLGCGGDRPNKAHWKSPFGTVGEIRWVKESWFNKKEAQERARKLVNQWRYGESSFEPSNYPDIMYKADYEGEKMVCKWKSPVTMPKWASRLNIKILSVKVEKSDKWEWVVNVKKIEDEG